MGNKKSKPKQPQEMSNKNGAHDLLDAQKEGNTLRAIQHLEKLPKYDRKQDLLSFVKTFIDEQVLTNLKLEVKIAKLIFAKLFENDERTLYNSIPDELKTNDDWDGYVNALIHVFHTQAHIQTALGQLKRMEQRWDESVLSFRTRIEKAVGFAYPYSESDRLSPSLHFFVMGLKTPLRKQVLDKGVLGTLNGAFDIAQLFEVNEQYEEAMGRDDDSICQINALTVDDEPKSICYFAIERKQSYESARKPHSEVTTNCGGELTSMSELVQNVYNQFGIVNELELVLARGEGLFVDATPQYARRKFLGQFICDEHLGELSRQWNSKKWQRHIVRKYSKGETRKFCGITTHVRDITKASHFLSKEQAHKYLHHHHELFHVGLPICSDHAEEINTLSEVENDQALSNHAESMDRDFDESHQEMIDAKRVELEEAFAKYAAKANVKGVGPLLNFGTSKPDSKMRKVYAMHKITNVSASMMAPNHKEELMTMFKESIIPKGWNKSTKRMDKVLEVVAEQYEKAEDRKSREIILSSIVNGVDLRELHHYIPGLSSRKYHNARIRAMSFAPPIEVKIRRTRFEPIKLHYYINFITSPIVSTGIPYGERKVKMSDGSYASIPNTIRLHRNAEIIRMYKKHMEDIGKKDLILKDTVAHAILNKCAATRRHALTCVDYFMAEGADAFEDIDDILNTLQGSALLDADMAKLWKNNVAQAKLYLKTDFRMHLKKESKVIEHCYLHSLSDPDNSSFRYNGAKHAHTVRCPRCVMIESTFREMINLLETLDDTMDQTNPSKKTVSEMIIRMEQNVDRIMEMKKHLVRAGYTDLERARIISELKNGEAFVTMDFAQKYLALYKYEDQRKYFGKRGMPWHITHVIAKVNDEFVQHSIVHVLHTKKQDNHSVVQMIDHVLSKLRQMKIKGVHFRADNAGEYFLSKKNHENLYEIIIVLISTGAYHSLGTISSIPYFAKKNGVAVFSFSFSEAQNGKSSCDRVAAQVKRKLRDYVARGNNIKNARDLFTGISVSGLKGLSVYRATVKREKTEKDEKALAKDLKPKMDGISGYGHFAFDDNTVRVWKMHSIGVGRVYTDLVGFQRVHRVLKIEEEGGFLASRESAEADEASIKKGEHPERFWTGYLSKKGKIEEEPDDVDEIDHNGQETVEISKKEKGLFTCNECGVPFINYGNFIRHLDMGRHRIRPEKIHLYDYALQLFKQNLEDIRAHSNVLTEVSEAMTEMGNGEDLSSKEGWALRGKRKHIKYSEKAKKFAEKLFKRGEDSDRKMDPAEVERLMKEETSIKPFERMNAQQIRSYFGTLCKAKKASKVSQRSRKRDEMEEEVDESENVEMEDDDDDWEDLSDEDVENIDDFGRQMDDVIEDIIYENHKKLFLNDDEDEEENEDEDKMK